tara:strand:- start:135 stop:251 length:117 start_codon:yes stop_codon:yes gene_type:complete
MYTKKDQIIDAIAAVCFTGMFFVVAWVAFAMDVMTTGM